MAIQIDKHQALKNTETQLTREGFRMIEHQHNGLIFEKEDGGYLYKALMDMSGRIQRYKPIKRHKPARVKRSAISEQFTSEL
jgi:hypothetical protein